MTVPLEHTGIGYVFTQEKTSAVTQKEHGLVDQRDGVLRPTAEARSSALTAPIGAP